MHRASGRQALTHPASLLASTRQPIGTSPNVLKSLKFQRLPGETPGVLTAGEADVLEGRNCNYFTEYEEAGNFVAEGKTFAGRWFDYEFGLAWLKKAVTRDLAIAFTSPDQVEGTNAGAWER